MAGPALDGLLNPAMLRWAREQSRIELADAARRVNQSVQRLEEWESGERTPTLNQLRGLANMYKRSVGVFFLREIPQVPRRPRDYRRLELSADGILSPKAANGIRECEAKRDAALDIHLEMETEPSTKSGADPFVVALAEVKELTVVTYETMAKQNAAPKIPNVCAARGLGETASLVDVLRAAGFRL